MSSGHNKNGTGHRRKKGDWKLIANGRNGNNCHARYVNPMACAPRIGDVGSAAYRRMIRVGK